MKITIISQMKKTIIESLECSSIEKAMWTFDKELRAASDWDGGNIWLKLVSLTTGAQMKYAMHDEKI